MARFIIEGEWTGYTSSQRRIVHREVVSKKMAETASGLRAIVYTDGTSLLVRVRQAEPREHIKIKNAYSGLIRAAIKSGGSRVLVADLT